MKLFEKNFMQWKLEFCSTAQEMVDNLNGHVQDKKPMVLKLGGRTKITLGGPSKNERFWAKLTGHLQQIGHFLTRR